VKQLWPYGRLRSPRIGLSLLSTLLLFAMFTCAPNTPNECSEGPPLLTGRYVDDADRIYFLQQDDTEIRWAGFDFTGSFVAPDFQLGGTSFSTVFEGKVTGTQIDGAWSAVPRGWRTGQGNIALKIKPVSGTSCATLDNILITKVTQSGDGFPASDWSFLRALAGIPPGVLPGDDCKVDCRFNKAQRNDEHSMAEHMSAGEGPNEGIAGDNVSIYGRVATAPTVNYPGYPGAVDVRNRPLVQGQPTTCKSPLVAKMVRNCGGSA
jgi:hypothetical protein